MRQKRLFVFLLMLLLTQLLSAPLLMAQLPAQLRFSHITTRDGLSSSSVSGILQDRQGIIWIATQAGLNRYDGYTFKTYENDPFNRNSLSHNLIQTMYLDDDGIIWLGTYGGLNRFDPVSENFTFYARKPEDPQSLSNNVVVAINRDAEGSLWVGTLEGLNRLDEKSGTFTRYLPDPDDEHSISDKVIRSILTDRRGNLWIGTYSGLCRYVPEEDNFECFGSNPEDPESLPSPFVMTIIRDPHNDECLWLGTWGGGVTAFDTGSGTGKTFDIPAREVYQLLYDTRGRLWAGTWGGGLVVLDPVTGKNLHISSGNTGFVQSGLSHNVVYSLFEDMSGIIWIGTNGGGVNTYVEWENRNRFIANEPGNPESLAEGKVTAILDDTDDTIWIGVYAGGLNRYNPETGRIVHYRHEPDNPQSLSNNIVNKIFRDRRGRLWIGTNEGLNRYLPTVDGFERIYADGTEMTPPENIIYEITEDSRGNLWFGTNSFGAVRYNPETAVYSTFTSDPEVPGTLSDNLVRSILEDREGEIWIGTNNGLNRFQEEGGRFNVYRYEPDRPDGLSSDNIRNIIEDSAGTLWIATTGGGLNRYHRETDSFETISRRDGLISNHIFGVVEGANGQLWISTNRGVNVFDVEKKTFRTIDSSNGLLSNELTGGISRGRDGSLFIGSVNGITIIKGEEDDEYRFTPPLVLTSFEVVGQPRQLQAEADGSYGEIELDYSDTLFSFQVSALDYSAPERNQYAFMLEGFEKEWNYTGTRNYVRYTNLNPGSYTLRIIGAGSRGNWNDTGLTVPITIRSPWWSSPLAFFFYALSLTALLIAAGLWIRAGRLRAEARYTEQERINRQLDIKVRERTAEFETSRKIAEQATRAKSLFLANMSHEIRTPLTGMLGMFSLLSRTILDDSQRSLLEHSRIAAESLNQLVSDLLDVETIESGTLKLHEEPFSITAAARYVGSLFLERARLQNLELELELSIPEERDIVYGDRNRFIQILSNLVSNAIKYTDAGMVVVALDLSEADTESEVEGLAGYSLRVRDTGVGIPRDKFATIYESFSQLDTGYSKSSKGAGLGLAIVKQLVHAMGGSIDITSRVGEGSEFIVSLNFRSGKLNPDDDESAAEPVRPTAPGTAGILVCEDEGINRLYLGNFLRDSGYPVDLAANGREALEMASRKVYSLILMDLGMPEMDGLEATSKIRSQESGHTPIIALTAHTYEEDIQKCLNAGMDDFVSKPIVEKVLLQKIRQWLGS
jgi:ligand-binding sensor domain-containing protein/signal transduction histidine kinase/CheY-like chemotaxis protein